MRFLPLAVLALGTSSLAQTTEVQAQPTRLHSYQGTLTPYSLSYRTGKLTKLDGAVAIPTTKHAVSTPTYVNNCTTGSFIGTGPTDELVDWGVKSGGASTLVDSFSFAYATDAIDVSMGGPGASVEVAFYTGTTGFGTLGTEVARFSFTGLPGDPTGTTFSGFLLNVDLTAGGDFCLPDGAIGVGYCSTDPGTTGPFIIDVVTCANGADDAFDVFTCPAPTGPYIGTFNLGGAGDASFFIEINEDDGSDLATTAVNNGSGINPVLASDGGVPAVLGATWPVTVDNSGGLYNSSVGLWTVGAFAPGTLVLAGGEVIVDITNPAGFVITNSVLGMGLNDHSVFVPKTLSLLGRDLTFQAFLFGGTVPFQLTNGIDLHLGF